MAARHCNKHTDSCTNQPGTAAAERFALLCSAPRCTHSSSRRDAPQVLVLQLSNVRLLLDQPRPHRTRQGRLVVQCAAGWSASALASTRLAAAAAAAAAGAAAVRVVVGVAVALGLRLPILQLSPVVLKLAVAGGQLLARQEERRAVLVGAVPVQAGLRSGEGRRGSEACQLSEAQHVQLAAPAA